MSKKADIIGTLFSDSSSESSSSTLRNRKYYTSASDNNNKKNIHRSAITSADEKKYTKPPARAPLLIDSDDDIIVPDGFVNYNKNNIQSLKHNTLIQYLKKDDKYIKNKYFKRFDHIANSIVVGFFKHDKRNYTEKLNNIKNIFVKSISGGADPLHGTILIAKDQWKFIKRDSIISYKKKDNDEWIYKSKFNTFFTAPDGTTRMSMTNERGFAYVCNPQKISEMYRHVSDTDFKLATILKSIQLIETRLAKLEKKIHR